MEAVKEKRGMGKFHNRARLGVWIMTAQDTELRRLAEICGMSVTDAVGEALQIWINTTRKELGEGQ